jgi:hypothetical protein
MTITAAAWRTSTAPSPWPARWGRATPPPAGLRYTTPVLSWPITTTSLAWTASLGWKASTPGPPMWAPHWRPAPGHPRSHAGPPAAFQTTRLEAFTPGHPCGAPCTHPALPVQAALSRSTLLLPAAPVGRRDRGGTAKMPGVLPIRGSPYPSASPSPQRRPHLWRCCCRSP